MREKETHSSDRRPLLLLLVLFAIFAGCALFLLRYWRPQQQVAIEPTPVPAMVHERAYFSRYSETPAPSLPSPYLSTTGPTLEPMAAPTASPTPGGLLGGKYAWRFSDEAVLTDHSYSDRTISVSWDMYRDELSYGKPVTFYIADVLVQDVSSLTTAFAKGTYNAGGTTSIERIARKNNCIVAISGDFARWHQNGLIIRNGEVFRKVKYTSDLCVLYQDGVMETYVPGSLSLEEIMSRSPWQSWHFGPELLDHDGQPKTKFNTGVYGRNPRAVIGYYEPGHYCFVVVDGRQGKYSGGLDMKELSELMYTLGCVRAYNLDGGATAHMSWLDTVINSPSKERDVHDVICICFPQST